MQNFLNRQVYKKLFKVFFYYVSSRFASKFAKSATVTWEKKICQKYSVSIKITEFDAGFKEWKVQKVHTKKFSTIGWYHFQLDSSQWTMPLSQVLSKGLEIN